MSNRDLKGKTFGLWTVLNEGEPHTYGNKHRWMWDCICECGTLRAVSEQSLISGASRSCGCINKNRMKNSAQWNTTHGMSDTRLYRIYKHIKNRCYREEDIRYDQYGGRGIKMCDEWLNSFESFYAWSMNNGYDESLSIDRIDLNGDYCPENCRWADDYTQANNKTNNRVYTYNDETHTLAEWARIYNINYKCLWRRLDRGWSIEKSLTYNNAS